MKEAFTKIYQKERWGKDKGSGTGSSPIYCQKYLEYIQSLLQPGLNILDLGCGDWQLYRDFDWHDCNYVGVDIVEHVVQANAEKYPGRVFLCEDFSDPEVLKRLLLREDIAFDLVLVKDVFQHWPDSAIETWVDTIKNLPFKRIVTSNNWKHFRSPEKNGMPRDVNNNYLWAPIDMTTYGFSVVDYFPRGKFKQICTLEKP